VFTTVTDPAEQRPAELLSRQFRAPAPNRLWVADITVVRTWQGFCYTAFVTDACARKVVGWAVAASMRTEDLPLQAFEHAVWQANSDVSGLVHHSDRGSQYYRWYVPSGWPSLGSPPRWARGNSYDNALAEAVNAAYRTELINRGKPWRCIDDVELATAQWVFWYNEERLHETLGYVPPAEYEAARTGASHPASQRTPALATE
jgi:transposase InsO family protein